MAAQKLLRSWPLMAFLALASSSLAQTSTLTIAAQDREISERWPRPGTFVVRRTGGTQALSVPYYYAGSAAFGSDYRLNVGNRITIPANVNEVYVQALPLPDRRQENPEEVVIQLGAGTGYTLPGPSSARMRLLDSTENPTEEEATRFLIQAGFGADKENVQAVMTRNFHGWIKEQFSAPIQKMQPIITAKIASGRPVYGIETKIALWERVMMQRNQTANPPVIPDTLRHRVAYSLFQIFVVSQFNDTLGNSPEGVASYYDTLLQNSFGNYRDLLYQVTLHPCMGLYLSHLGNRKADPEKLTFPDENYARECMQLFSIGLWELNQDGSRKLVNGQPVPTYTNVQIREFAKVFTGFNFGGPDNNQFEWAGWNFVHPMKGWDSHHDLGQKRLLRGLVLPARTASNPDTGASAYADVNAAIDNLFNHPNVGPFFGRLLIQRLVTSNPSPGYISRVAGAFNNNGQGVRGDMKAVIRAVLLDPEARAYSETLAPGYGKKREPYMLLFNMAKAYNARAKSGKYDAAIYYYDVFLQEPFSSPSVFNFYRPDYRPSGAMTANGLYGPEFQILTATNVMSSLNEALDTLQGDLSRWSPENPDDRIKLDLSAEMALAQDPDALVRQAVMRLIGGPVSPRTFEIISKAVRGIPAEGAEWRRARANTAIYLTLSSVEFQIQK